MKFSFFGRPMQSVNSLTIFIKFCKAYKAIFRSFNIDPENFIKKYRKG